MDSAIKTKWLAALRSGRYPQGRGRLCNTSRHYCCLGVLAKVQGAFDAELACAEILDRAHNLDKYAAGLSGSEQQKLASLNDGTYLGDGKYDEPLLFVEIADFIERDIP